MTSPPQDWLQPDELAALSEYRTAAGQRRWLERNHIPYVASRNGRPRVHRQALARAMGSGDPPVEHDSGRRGAEPDFGAIA